MQIQEDLKNIIVSHRSEVELTQWAVISAVSSLVYSEYLRKMKNKMLPVQAIYVAEVKAIEDLLSKDGQFMILLSNRLLDGMNSNRLFKKYTNIPELVLFTRSNEDILKSILNLYIIPNISKRISETITLKFQLNSDEQQTFRQSPDIDLFDREPINDKQLQFVIDQAVLQLLILLPSVQKELIFPTKNTDIHMTQDDVLAVGNQNAICNILFNTNIFSNDGVIELLKFVTSTSFNMVDKSSYIVNTSDYNKITLIRLKDTQVNTEVD